MLEYDEQKYNHNMVDVSLVPFRLLASLYLWWGWLWEEHKRDEEIKVSSWWIIRLGHVNSTDWLTDCLPMTSVLHFLAPWPDGRSDWAASWCYEIIVNLLYCTKDNTGPIPLVQTYFDLDRWWIITGTHFSQIVVAFRFWKSFKNHIGKGTLVLACGWL